MQESSLMIYNQQIVISLKLVMTHPLSLVHYTYCASLKQNRNVLPSSLRFYVLYLSLIAHSRLMHSAHFSTSADSSPSSLVANQILQITKLNPVHVLDVPPRTIHGQDCIVSLSWARWLSFDEQPSQIWLIKLVSQESPALGKWLQWEENSCLWIWSST